MPEETQQTLKEELQQKRALAGVHHVTHECEIIAEGVYCPVFTVSTNDKTAYVTITYAAVDGKSVNMFMTKSEYLKFTTQLTMFMNAFLHDSKEKQLIKG